MDEEKIILLEKYLEGILSEEEKPQVDNLLLSDPEFKKEFEEQTKVKNMINKMSLKNPSVEFWDSYWLGVYNRIERGLAWILISIGMLIVLGFGAFHLAEAILTDPSTPLLMKYALAFIFFGGTILLFSVAREKFTVNKKDKYKEIQR
ncbi:MAG: hypothetical protein ACEPO8_14410 [Rhodothermaceae bacterium]